MVRQNPDRCQLLAEKQVLGKEGGLRAQQARDEPKDICQQNCHSPSPPYIRSNRSSASIKDAAKKKSTYIAERSGAATMEGIYESIWASAIQVLKG